MSDNLKSKETYFFEVMGIYPEDMFGADWENYIDYWFNEQRNEPVRNTYKLNKKE